MVVWGILVGLVIVGMAVGKMMWKRRAAENREAERSAVAREALASVTKAFACLANGKADLVTGAIVHSIETPAKKVCNDEIEPVGRNLTTAAEKLGVRLEDLLLAQYFGDFDNYAQLKDLCSWAGSVGAAANQLATKTRLAKVAVPACDVDAHALALVEPPVTLGGNSVAAIHATTELQLQYRDEANDGYVMARSTDGTLWQTQPMPPHWYAGYAWTDDAFVATVSERPEDDNAPYLVNVLDANRQWVRRARVQVPVIDSVHVVSKQDVAIVASDFAAARPPMLLRSRDGGKTFSRPVTLAGKAAHIRAFEVTMRPDASAIAFVEGGDPEVQFDVLALAATAKAPETKHAFTWANPGGDSHHSIDSCHAGTVQWTLVRGRFLVITEDGLAWRLVHAFPEVHDAGELACTPDRFAVTFGTEAAMVQTCDRKACGKPIAFHRSDGAAVALRFDGANLALWLGTRFSQVHMQTGEPAALAVYRVEQKLVLDRVRIAATSGKLPVVQDKHGFFKLSAR
jgi:hypothetical protein